MADNTSRGPKGTQWQEATGMPVRLVRGHASPEELAALIAIFATAGDGRPDPTDRHTPTSATYPQSPWNSPRRMVRMAHPHGPGGWRASASPR